jgi:hypothetical protein
MPSKAVGPAEATCREESNATAANSRKHGCGGVGSTLLFKENAADTQPTTFRNKPRVSLREIALAMKELGATAGGRTIRISFDGVKSSFKRLRAVPKSLA